ncbi:alkaline proteinase [Verticillium alfalfae VaMs.102]|uniref:Alkaline proteinase n=1 Tax=Verticillium alfalfae (strain VaMs.102 / ATCC MYA-4576 / FGSC 10136) TaxID=526221 RepID=C9SL04_VERA1|nr:alkaline proteinase [Verticillium alfalfae VaMs.102]EEY19372.1 alkaline proteinase [Verticillium alfalfae VaMs.102]
MSGETIPGEWLVTLKPYANESIDSEHTSLLSTRTADPDTHFNCDVQCHFALPELRGYSAKFDDATRAEVEALPEVQAVEPLQVYRHCAAAGATAVQSNAPWGLARISQRGRVSPAGPWEYKYDANAGAGTVAYILDTGIRDTHDEFEGRASKGPTFSQGRPASDEDATGTAPRRRHHRRQDPGATNADIIRALEWVVDQVKSHGKPSVVNMSLGGGASAALDAAVASTVRAGIVVVVAAGNDGRPSDRGSPAREPLAITVGASDVEDAGASFTSWGKIVDIFAPGVDIKSSWNTGDDAVESLNGTSMASPHVAGAVCYLLSQKRVEPLLVMPQLLGWADKNKLTGLKDRTIDALLVVSDN